MLKLISGQTSESYKNHIRIVNQNKPHIPNEVTAEAANEALMKEYRGIWILGLGSGSEEI